MIEIEYEGKVYLHESCAVSGCENIACRRLESIFCYPHSKRQQDMVIKQLDKLNGEILLVENAS